MALVVMTIFAFHYCRENRQARAENVELRNKRTYTAEVIQDYVAPDSTKHQTIKDNVFISPESVAAIDTGYIDSIAMALNVANDKITELTRVRAALTGRLKASIITMDSLNNRTYTFSGRFLNAILTERDSMLKYKYNAEISIVKYRKRKNLFSPEYSYIDLSSNDPNMKINGLYQFTIKHRDKVTPFGIGLQMGYYFYPEYGVFRPAIGAGVSYNLIRF